MTISPDDAVGHVMQGQTYYFCSQSCLDQFRSAPDAFLAERSAGPLRRPTWSGSTCPMDRGAAEGTGRLSEVRNGARAGHCRPGHEDRVDVPDASRDRSRRSRSCPICGMALEPRVVTIEENNPELDDMTRQFWWSAAITVPMLAFMISEFLPDGHSRRYPHGWMNWIQLALATPVVVWGGWPFCPWVGIGRQPAPQYVHAHRAGRRSRLRLQRHRHARPWNVPGFVPDHGRGRRVLRARSRHCGPRAARSGAGAACAQSNKQRDSKSAGPRAKTARRIELTVRNETCH